MGISSEGTGAVFDFEGVAISGGEMPDGLTGPEQRLFLGLRALYHQKRVGIITREVAVAEKKRLVHTYNKDEADSLVSQTLIAHHSEINNQAWRLIAEYRKNQSPELADRILKILDGRLEPCQTT